MDRIPNSEFETQLPLLLKEIHLKYGYDFRHYSPASLRRTLIQAMSRTGCETLSVLQDKVLLDSDCFYAVIQSLTISVTEMFRDPAYFLALREKVIPLLKTYPSIKVWIAGCSTGEEVFSLSILLQEEDLLERAILYATDINPRCLEKAKEGTFPLKELESATLRYQMSGGKSLFSNYYTSALDTVRFNDDLKRNITFADHSLVTDSVFSETHLISCRNVLIYFDRELQNKTLGLFRESLCRKGFLGLGSKETVQFSEQAAFFEPIDKKNRIYQKT
jgi:chemotaxis protein methyltransferase CheR